MCGRFSQTKSRPEIIKRFNVKEIPDGIERLFNIVPQQSIPAILNESSAEVSLVRWGIIPSWAKEEKTQYRMINARAETLLEKPAYKRLIQKKRCLIIADSFYEWSASPKSLNGSALPDQSLHSQGRKHFGEEGWNKTYERKIPYRIMLKSGDLFSFAGLWDLWKQGDKTIFSCSVITTSSNQLLAKIHDRMPVILPREKEREWLSDIPVEKALQLLKPYASDEMKCYEISLKVNNPLNNSAEIILPV